MKKIIALTLIYATNAAASEISYNSISEAKSERIGNIVARYLISRDNYPCLNVEILDPDNKWKILSTKEICSLQKKSFVTDFADVTFEDIKFSKDGLHTILSITPLRSGEELLRCLIPIKESTIGELQCNR